MNTVVVDVLYCGWVIVGGQISNSKGTPGYPRLFECGDWWLVGEATRAGSRECATVAGKEGRLQTLDMMEINTNNHRENSKTNLLAVQDDNSTYT
jgi:hypothetical protein